MRAGAMKTLAVGLLAALGLTLGSAHAQLLSSAYVKGKQYQVLPGAVKPAAGKPIVIQEFFWYGCPHCFRLDPMITAWAKTLPKGVVFERVPDALGRPIGVVHEQAYYIAQQLGILDQTHKALFDAIHVDNRPMATLREIRDLYVGAAGIDPKKFDDASSSMALQLAVKRADALAVRDAIDSVPTLVIGQYYKTNGAMAAAGHPDQPEAKSFEEMLKIARALALQLQAGGH